MALLDITDLSVSIGATPILNRIALQIEPGEVLGLVGKSGAGKTMTALSIMRLLPTHAGARGRIALAGEDLMTLDKSAMCDRRGRQIGMVFQEPATALNPLKTIGDQVGETVRIHRGCSRREAMATARQALEHVGLPSARFPLGLYPHELSGGQRQRVVIAMAVALKPPLLIADEPTAALDVTTQARILALLKRLVADDGIALLLISHDLAMIAEAADRVAIVKDGAIVEAGETTDVFRRPRHPYAARSSPPPSTGRAVKRGLPSVAKTARRCSR